MNLKIIIILSVFLLVNGCKTNPKDCEHIIEDNAQYSPAQILPSLSEVIFVTEETPDACYSYALNYIANQSYEGINDQNCGISTLIGYDPYKHKVLETSSRLIYEKESLTTEEIASYASEYCYYGYGSKIEDVTNIEVKDDKIYFSYTEKGRTNKAFLSTHNMNLACPLYSINCYKYDYETTEED